MNKKYIDAEHFKRRVMAAAFELNDNAMYNVAKAICEKVDFESAADVAPAVHGEWIEGAEHFTNGFYDAECSKCGTYISWNEGNSGEWHFCPNCGAKMDGGTP